MIWVLDASVAVRWFLAQESHPHADLVLERILSQPEKFAVPELFGFEVFAVLCRVHPEGPEVFVEGMVPVLNCGMLRYPMTESLAAGASVYIGEGLTGYDACYAALAEELGGKWLTFDDKAHKAIEKYNVSHLASMDLPDEFIS